MTEFTLHDKITAPEGSQVILDNALASLGMIPNIYATMAEAPGLLQAYDNLNRLFMDSSFSKEEMTVVWQTINVEHECHYCVPAHTGIAKSMKVDDAITEALRNETPLPTEHLETLRTFTLSVVRHRGNVEEPEVQAFLDAGYTKRQVLEVILGAAQKVISNYTNHLAKTPIDKPFQKFSWQKAD